MKYRAEGDYIIADDVPLFDQHGKFDEATLAKMVKVNNDRIEDTGDYAPVCIGHTRDDADENTQPEIVGYVEHFSLGKIGNRKPRAAILGRVKFHKDKWETVRKYPRRSIELWKDGTIDPVSLLGATTPQRDLSLLFSKKNHSEKTLYKHMDENLVSQLMEMLDGLPEFQFIRQQMAAQQQAPAAPAPAQMAADPNAQVPMPGKEDDKPALFEADDDDKEGDKDFPAKMQRLKSEREQYKKAHDLQAKEINELKRKFRRAEREKDLIDLSRQDGIMFDMKDELEEVADLDENQYQRHLKRMKTRYSRDITHVNLTPVRVADYGPREFTAADADKAVKLSTNKGIPYSEAVDAVMKGN
jgi:hypothetical protein